MSILYVLVKIYPVFGLTLGVLMLDLGKTLRRRANPVWIGMFIFAAMFFISAIIWLVMRGDKYADRWYYELSTWL